MTTDEITKERLMRWRKKLALSNATPLALVGIGQAHKSGEIVLCICEDGLSDSEIAAILQKVAIDLARRDEGRN